MLLLTMGPQLGITASIPTVAVGGAGTITFHAVGAVGQVKWSIVADTLPPEWDDVLTPAGSAATVSTPAAVVPGTYSITVRAVDDQRVPVVRSFYVRVAALPLTISGAFPAWSTGVPATGALTISGGLPPYTGLTITSGALPAGVSLSIVGSQIVPSGSPVATGTWAATIGVLDSEGSPAQINVSGEVAGDPYAAYVSALLHFDGPDGSTVFVDATGKTWTASGNAQIDTAQSMFGGASGLFDGDGDYINTPSHADFTFGTSNVTVELFFRTAVTNGAAVVLCKHLFNTGSWVVYRNGTSIQLYVSSNGSSWDIANGIVIGTVAAGNWYHVAWSRSGSSFYTFLDGAAGAGATSSASIYNGSQPVTVGGNPGYGDYFSGHIDELRITKGVARYTANFTPPTYPYPDP